ncbi:MAG: HTTM domain-containing protein [Planctomycetaceae bacterium]|nr:HTTM domain-containing protein [Planctomycetaceae bacterium]
MGRTSVVHRRSGAAVSVGVIGQSEQPITGSLKNGVGAVLKELSARATHVVTTVFRAWDSFWFSPADPTVLGLMRILVGGMLVYTHLVWGINLPAFLGSAGWNSPDVLTVVQDGLIVPSFWWYVSDSWMYTVHWMCIGILTLFWLGCATRVTSILSLMITISYSYRAHMSNFGLDQLNAILCLYLCIGPSGAVLSVDRWLKVRAARRLSERSGKPFVLPAVLPDSSAGLAIRLTQMHFCVIYAYAGLSKLQGPAWWSGEAVWMAFANLEYQSLDMTWVAWYPWISDLMTHSTIVWEVFFPAMVWVRPIRPAVLGIGFLLHLGIGGMMGMWTFALIMIFGHISFWPDSVVQRVTAVLPIPRFLLGPPRPTAETRPATGMAGIAQAVASAAAGVRLPKLRRSSTSRPALLCVDRGVKRRLHCLGYFLERGFHCLTTDDIQEAEVVYDATDPDAVVVLGEGMADRELKQFHQRHNSHPAPRPLFFVLSEGQSQRLNGGIRGPHSHVLNDSISLGHLRREIQASLNRSAGHESLPTNDAFERSPTGQNDITATAASN